MNKTLFCFKFRTCHKNNSLNSDQEVYSYDRESIEAFIKQHNFENGIEYIECITDKQRLSEVYDSENILKPFILCSNKTNHKVTVMTTNYYIESAIEEVCYELSQSLILGPPAVDSEVELFRVINDLIEALPYTYILDQGIAEDYDVDPDLIDDKIKYAIRCEPDDSLLYEMIFDQYQVSTSNNLPQPITLESYVSYFTNMMIDMYDNNNN